MNEAADIELEWKFSFLPHSKDKIWRPIIGNKTVTKSGPNFVIMLEQ